MTVPPGADQGLLHHACLAANDALSARHPRDELARGHTHERSRACILCPLHLRLLGLMRMNSELELNLFDSLADIED